MSFFQNFDYAIIQVAHNFGAVAVVGGSFAALKFRGVVSRKELARVVLAGWIVQAASGAALGAVSYLFYHQFPDIAGIAIVALGIKIFCAVLGGAMMAVYLFWGDAWSIARINIVWILSSVISSVAISAAAFLRWFS